MKLSTWYGNNIDNIYRLISLTDNSSCLLGVMVSIAILIQRMWKIWNNWPKGFQKVGNNTYAASISIY